MPDEIERVRAARAPTDEWRDLRGLIESWAIQVKALEARIASVEARYEAATYEQFCREALIRLLETSGASRMKYFRQWVPELWAHYKALVEYGPDGVPTPMTVGEVSGS